MLPNCSGVARRLAVMMGMTMAWPSAEGSCPRRPAAYWLFETRIARATSPGVTPSWAILSGRNQTRIE